MLDSHRQDRLGLAADFAYSDSVKTIHTGEEMLEKLLALPRRLPSLTDNTCTVR